MQGTDPAKQVAAVDALAARRQTRAGGVSMVWRTWGEGRPLLLLHGASGSWTHWIRNVLPLAAHFRVLAPDMPGFGDSATLSEPHTADRLAAAVAAGLDEILPAPAELDLAGFSFGGIIAGWWRRGSGSASAPSCSWARAASICPSRPCLRSSASRRTRRLTRRSAGTARISIGS